MAPARTPLAKISTPRLFGIVERARLFARLDANRGRPLIRVEGPPGAGKTTLVASYLEARRIPTLWYQVDAGDADPANLFHYLAIAIAGLVPHGRPALPRLAPEHLDDLAAFARKFFREAFACLPAGAVIVLDNYQEVADAAPLHEIAHTATAEVPPDSSLCMISRAGPPPLFAQLTGSGAAFTLEWEALRLTLEETRAISAARALRDEWLVRALHQQSDGWAAGITLMLERLQHSDGDARALQTDTRESVFDYFTSLLFDHAPVSTRDTLMRLAYVPHVTPSMAANLCGNDEAGALLENLYRRHLFTDRRPGAEPVYQFHALFRDFLQRRAGESMSAHAIRQLHVDSARALAQRGDVEPAMELMLAARHWDEAVQLVLAHASAWIQSARWQTLERWISALPCTLRNDRPALLYWLGAAQLQSDPAQGLAVLLQARAAFARTTDREGRMLCLAALLNTAQMGHAAIPAADAWLGELLDEVEHADGIAGSAVELPVWAALLAVLLYWRPWHPIARSARERVQRLLEGEADASAALSAAATALVTDTGTGNLEAGEELLALIEPLTRRAEASPSASAWFLYGAAYLRFIQTRYEEALDYLARAMQAASDAGLNNALSDLGLYRVMVEFRAPGWQVADHTLREIEAQPLPKRPMSLALLRIYQARRSHFHGRWAEAAELAKHCQEAISRVGAPQNLMTFGLFNAEILIGAGQTEEAQAWLARSLDIIARSSILDCWRAAGILCEAFLAHAHGRRDEALALLTRALDAAEAGNRRYYLRYMECCMPPMFCLALQAGVRVELVQQLIRSFRLKPPPDAPAHWPRVVRVHTLGRFEVRIHDQPLEFSRKVPRKTLALLKALIAYRSEAVPEQWLCDALWGDEEADAARQVLGVTVSRLRKLLGSDDAVIQQGGRVWIDRQLCWVDAWHFAAASSDGRDERALREAFDLYAGAFLPDDECEAWTVSMRERLRGKFIHALATHGEALEQAGDLEAATRLYLRGIDADVVVEAFHRALMRCYRRSGRLTEAVSAYRRLRQTLSAVLGIAPSPESEAIYREIMDQLCAGSPVAPVQARHCT